LPEHPVYQEAEFVVDLFVHPLSPTTWGAYGVVLRGIPAGWGMDPHPNFTGVGATRDRAVDAMLEALNGYLDGGDSKAFVIQ
jgi:hypothetical protein